MAVDTQPDSVTDDMIEKGNKGSSTDNGSWWSSNWRAIISELISTIFLLFLGCMTCIPIDGFTVNPPIYGTLGFGLIVLINIQTFGHISGAHMNPAVTFAAVIWGKMSVVLGIAYFIAQVAGAVIGYGMLMGMSPIELYSDGICTTQPHARHNIFQAFGIEIFLTASLVLLNCAVWDPVNEEKNESNSIKFGLTIAGLSVAGGPLTGASMNPARSFAPAVWTNTWNGHWLYWLGPFVGSALATIFYKYVWLNTEKVISVKKLPEAIPLTNNNIEV